jgi:purine nucleosidase
MAVSTTLPLSGGRSPTLVSRWSVTVVAGNVERDAAARTVLTVLEAAGRPDIPVALGERGPIGRAPARRDTSVIHGRNGLGNMVRPPPSVPPVEEAAGDLLRRLVAERPGELTVVAIGPLSTLGRAVSVDRRFAERVGALVVMGGSIAMAGSGGPAVEANFRHDPRAAQAVAEAPWTAPPLLLPLDVTLATTLGDDEFEALGARATAAASFLDEPLRFYRAARGGGACPCHDLLAVMAAVDPEVVVDTDRAGLQIDTRPGASWGATTLTTAGRRWHVAVQADVDRFRRSVRVWLRTGKHSANITPHRRGDP